MRILKSIVAATMVLGAASAALADDGTDPRLDTSRYAGPVVQQQLPAAQFSSRNVSRSRAQMKSSTPSIASANGNNGAGFTSSRVSLEHGQRPFIDVAGANHDNGGN